jgi:hypothetical protein
MLPMWLKALTQKGRRANTIIKVSKTPNMNAQVAEAAKDAKSPPKVILVRRDSLVRTESSPFLLHEGDFLRLTKLPSNVSTWAHRFFGGTTAFFVTLCAKWVDSTYFGGSVGVTSLDWIILSILVLVTIVFELAHLILPSERKKTVKKIQAHFRASLATAK